MERLTLPGFHRPARRPAPFTPATPAAFLQKLLTIKLRAARQPSIVHSTVTISTPLREVATWSPENPVSRCSIGIPLIFMIHAKAKLGTFETQELQPAQRTA